MSHSPRTTDRVWAATSGEQEEALEPRGPYQKYCVLVLSLIATALSVGCSSSIKYDSHCKLEALRQLKGKSVVLIQFDNAGDTIVGATPLEAPVAKAVAEAQRAEFLRVFKSTFNLSDASVRVASVYGKVPQQDPVGFVKRVLRDLRADGGFIVSSSYAYKMNGGSIKDHFVDAFLRQILPDKWVGPLTGPSQIESYDFASRTVLYNRQGQVVWSFYGKASAMPKLTQMLTPTQILRSAAGLDPSSQNLAAAIVHVSEKHEQFLYWMMQEDLAGVGSKNYFRDYPSDQKDRYIVIFPADDKSHVPFVKGYDPTEP
jgi:hypothetical protein